MQEKSKEIYLENDSLKIVVLSGTPDILKNTQNSNCECVHIIIIFKILKYIIGSYSQVL